MSKTRATVCIVGGGPVGLLTALRLGQAGIDTLVVEAHDSILPTTRAVVYMPVIIPALTKLGIFESIKREAYLNKEGITWRDLEGKSLAKLPLGDKHDDEFGGVLLLGQYKLAMIILEELEKYPCVEVHFGLRCCGIEDVTGSEAVKLLCSRRSDNADEIIHAEYVVGTDGANSAVRRMLCIQSEGFTYSDWKMIGTDILYDFVGEEGYTPLNFIVHPEHWAVIAYTGQDEGGGPSGTGIPQYRVAYVEKPDLPSAPEEYLERAQKRLPVWMNGSKNFKLLRAEPYINSQKVASQAIKGRVMLAGDALHSNNPIGGLGLTSGIADAFCFGNALTRVIKHGESQRLLTECANSRRQTWIEATNMLSQANISRLYGFDQKTTTAREAFFEKLRTDSAFPSVVRAGMDKMMTDTFE
ncbi:uncharacterized protein HMPREF1541_00953 [Cyphellophora europaea CBS 101466]|uniref:FAD-binding domain-containing protein n=1 Tax=Cyphellophora europaea (strain CBS 101466) TaxID=1220924 RepID=W2SFT6_CYPE1|nr:uncharacterized protein HMPREF1541_00953 [Cyphellophora europaea CBS 101466]ETN46764.1 hypothetical protein HMPREF1541_00953 [Cyphellophora europaea CBS 101466]